MEAADFVDGSASVDPFLNGELGLSIRLVRSFDMEHLQTPLDHAFMMAVHPSNQWLFTDPDDHLGAVCD